MAATDTARRRGAPRVLARLTTETKQAFKTTEFWGYVVTVVGVLVAAAVIGDNSDSGNNAGDQFPAVRAWLYITILTAAYIVGRGLAKSGSRDPYWAGEHDLPGGRERD